MPLQLLPASAAAFAPRSPPTIVLNAKVEPWLTQTLKRISKVRRPLHSVPQHFKCLTEVLGGEAAIWDLCSLLLPRAPEKDLLCNEDRPEGARSDYAMAYVQAYIVHVDMVAQHEVAFKLTAESIDSLVEYHRNIYSVDTAASIYDWPEKNDSIKKLQEDFRQAVNRFVYRADAKALEGLEEGGAGELLEQRSATVKLALMNLFVPLTPPPPTIVDVVIPAPLYPQQASVGWWQPQQSTFLTVPPMQGNSWPILPSTPSPTMTDCSDPWNTFAIDVTTLDTSHYPSPTPSGSHFDYSCDSSLYTTPVSMSVMPVMPMYAFPSQLPHACGSSFADSGFDSMTWDFNSFATPQYAAVT